MKELHRLKNFLDDGEAVRIWYSDAPYSRCGLYSLCRILKGYENKWLGEVPIKEGRLIGDILCHAQLGVGDCWYARRIEHYIGQGKICVVEDLENKYARMICRSR